MTNKLKVNHDHVADDYVRRAYIEGRLRGDAAKSLMPYLASSHSDQLQTADQVLSHLWDEYHDPNKQEKARVEYEKLEMKPGDDFATFKNCFVRLAGQCRKPETEWKAELKRKLPTRLQTALVGHFIDPNVDFDKYTRLASEIDLNLKQADEKRDQVKATNGRGRKNAPPTATPAPKNGTVPTPANNPRARPTGSQHGKLSVEELKKLMSEGRCFTCREAGHNSRECPQKKA